MRIKLPNPIPDKLRPRPRRPGDGNGNGRLTPTQATIEASKDAGISVVDWLDERTSLSGAGRCVWTTSLSRITSTWSSVPVPNTTTSSSGWVVRTSLPMIARLSMRTSSTMLSVAA